MSRRGTRGRVPRPGGVLRRSAALVLALALTCGLALALGLAGLALTPGTAAADEPQALASISLTSVSPSVPSRDDTITLSGRVTNTSKSPLVRPQALLWRDESPITDSDGLDAALASASNSPIGSRVVEPGAYQNLYSADDQQLAPGRSATFTVSAKISDLALSPTDGVFLIGVHVTQNGVPVAIARSRVLVPVLAHAPTRSMQKATLVVLTSRPSMLAPGLLADDHLARDVAAGGRLRVLLDAARVKGASYAVDPELVSELETMRAGYQVRASSGATTSGRGQADAARWLTDLGQLRAAHDGYRLLYGSPDVAALAHSRRTGVLKDAAEAGERVQATSGLPLLVLPTGGTADTTTLQAAAALHPRAVVLSDSTTRGAGPLLASSTGTPVLTYAAGGLGGGPGPDPSDDPVHIQQRFLATSWIATTTADADGAAEVHLVQTKAQATSTDRTDPPWTRATPLATVLDRTPARWDGALRYPSSATGHELTSTQLSAVDRLASAQRTWADLLVDGAAAEAEGDAMVARATSGSWRGQRSALAAYLQPQQASLDTRLLDQVRISTSRKVSTVAQQGVAFPITIRNDLAPEGPGGVGDPAAIRVHLDFVSDNERRLTVKPIAADAVGILAPGSGFTGNAAVTARANGTVPVTAQLYTQSGRKVGRPVPIEVEVTQNGTTGWAIALVAGVVLVGSTTFRIRQVGRERARAAAPEDQGALGSVPASRLGSEHDDTPVGS